MLREYDVVIVSDEAPDAEIRGERGHIIGAVTTDMCGVFVYKYQQVWCLSPSDVVATGERDGSAERDRGQAIRVSRHGEVLD